MKYGSWTFGQVEALLNRLGEDNARKLLDCRKVTVTFDNGDKRATITGEAPSLTVWKTIKLGTGFKSAEEFSIALAERNFLASTWAQNMLSQPAFTVSTEETEIDLVCRSVTELGFEGGARYDSICVRAKELGLELCPAEVGPQLRLQYPDQPDGEQMNIAMEAIPDSDGDLCILRVVHDEDARWLNGRYSSPDDVFGGGNRLIFRLPRKQPSAV